MADRDKDIAATEEALKVSAAARLFDVRRVIGGLFVVYGLVVTLIGIFDNKSEIDKAQGVRINLWAGLGMLVLGLLFLLWQYLRPAEAPSAPSDDAADAGGGSLTAEE
jgi:hypothetical membrane protein